MLLKGFGESTLDFGILCGSARIIKAGRHFVLLWALEEDARFAVSKSRTRSASTSVAHSAWRKPAAERARCRRSAARESLPPLFVLAGCAAGGDDSTVDKARPASFRSASPEHNTKP